MRVDANNRRWKIEGTFLTGERCEGKRREMGLSHNPLVVAKPIGNSPTVNESNLSHYHFNHSTVTAP